MSLAIFLLLSTFGVLEASHFRGTYITWIVNTTDTGYYPANPRAASYKVHVKYGTSWRRSHGAPCTLSAISSCQQYNHGTWSVSRGTSENSLSSSYSSFSMSYYCERYSVSSDFNIGSKVYVISLPRSYIYKFQTASCCWTNDLATLASSSWNVEAILAFKINPSTGNINRPPQVNHLPLIDHNYYSRATYRFPVVDLDGDSVRCRWAANNSEGGGVWNNRFGTLDTNRCTLTLHAHMYTRGWHPLSIMVEDYAWKPGQGLIRLSKIPVQFTIRIHTGTPVSIFGKNNTNCGLPYPTKCLFCSTPSVTTSSVTTRPTTPGAFLIDGCTKYQILANPDRVSTYSDWSSYRCDKELYGWYRFQGVAGNRMLNYCPNAKGNAYNCGSYHQGWILSGAMPTVAQGTVMRNVCFSQYGTCSCAYTRSIYVRNCTSFHVYWINRVPACNSRYCGVKDKTSEVLCSQSNMQIIMGRAFYDISLYSSITLRDHTCQASISSNKITLGGTPGICGAIRRSTASHFIYENEVIFKARDYNGVVKDNDLHVKFSCQYNKNTTLSLLGYKPMYKINGSEAGYGNFSFSFDMYTDVTYTRMHSSYPVNAQLRDWLWLQLSVDVKDKEVFLLVDKCYSTPKMDPRHPLRHYFLRDRCPVNNSVSFQNSANNVKRLSMQAIRFLQNSTAVFFHCRVFLCHSTSTDPRCTTGCSGNRIITGGNRGKRDIHLKKKPPSNPSQYYLVEMQVKLKGEEKFPGGKKSDGTKVEGAGTFTTVGMTDYGYYPANPYSNMAKFPGSIENYFPQLVLLNGGVTQSHPDHPEFPCGTFSNSMPLMALRTLREQR
eukprot:Seg961.1 transcript_id=Seg961.1/GoldUCD/mRNA.D3Y31 product="Pancreatic secretory granule membrane major glycoprotein GP2" protein_id=Seg961.1/GoldUCD/D3Y31